MLIESERDMNTLFCVKEEILVCATCDIAEELDLSENCSSESRGPRSTPQEGVRIGVAGQGLEGVAVRCTGEAFLGEHNPLSKAVWSGNGLGPWTCVCECECEWDWD